MFKFASRPHPSTKPRTLNIASLRLTGSETTDMSRNMDVTNTARETAKVRSEIWMDDGNVVLQAGNVQFKVHRSALARVSTIFSDVFSMPQPSTGDETVDGCPLLCMQDSVQDVQHMLAILYDHDDDCPFFAAMIRMGRKYEITFLLQDATRRLKQEFPTTLTEYDNAPSGGWIAIEEDADTLYDCIDLAYLSDINEVRAILPFAYFYCNAYDDIEVILSGVGSEIEGVPVEPRRPMSLQAQKACLIGRQRLIYRFDLAFAWIAELGTKPEVCLDQHRCRDVVRDLADLLWRPEPHLRFMVHDWETFERKLRKYDIQLQFIQDSAIDLKKQLCAGCYDLARRRHLEEREITWNLLPSYFDLPDWDVLNTPTLR
ncbi:hypothetical protein NMY22_g14223 [Coprinellus aureogranulatus]|nr:hypothetical protein NMY22_g14223 [Coprinellus aureogranulatus]